MLFGSVKRGLLNGLKTTWILGKIIFPVTLIVSILQYTPLLSWLIELITPIMKIFGLSGDAAIPLVLGNVLNLYAGIGAILTLDFTVKEVFFIAVMLSFSHNLIVESSVAHRVGVKLSVMLAVRIGLSVVSALMINFIWKGGSEAAKYGFISTNNEEVSGLVNILLVGLEKASLGILQLVIIVMPMMVVIQILKDFKWLAVFSKWVSPFTRALGMKENTSTTMAAGLLFGLAYGAGVMIQAVKEDGVEKKDLTLAFIFLVACHAVVEDTLIFVPLGIPVIPLLLIRVITAILLTLVVALIWKRTDLVKREEATYEQ
ncbi:nucleoside recognition domain-containing protein [Bacillus aquiflavi]|uniref:nucleoside recognition domain-containing protein n=1 Tax=Bacillus aquiflavi TaxID=2672567 RepID=UPI001CA9C2BF|nr:nucleoside recognition domain-containing protein [Bacillus aquiflavi]UAC47825.1 nucleoside recognition domain-containing protein [Bacillus aquiflavi]